MSQKIQAALNGVMITVLLIMGWAAAAPSVYASEETAFYGYFRSQLDDTGNDVYHGYCENYVTEHSNVPFVVSLTHPIVIKGAVRQTAECNETANKTYIRLSIDKENTAYQKAAAQLRHSVSTASAAFLYDHPEVFWIRNFEYSYTLLYEKNEENTYDLVVRQVEISPREAYRGAFLQSQDVSAGINQAVTELSGNLSRYSAVKVIHDFVRENASYNSAAAEYTDYDDGADARTAAPFFLGQKENTFVCEGYAKAFKILCDQMGVPCVTVSGTGRREAHMWNYVEITEGKWYGVDVTWDDQPSADYRYFLVGSDVFLSDHHPVGQVLENSDVTLVYPVLQTSDYQPTSDGTDYLPDEAAATTETATTTEVTAAPEAITAPEATAAPEATTTTVTGQENVQEKENMSPPTGEANIMWSSLFLLFASLEGMALAVIRKRTVMRRSLLS